MKATEQRISAIEAHDKRSSRRSIYIDGQFTLAVDESVIAELGLRVGQPLKEDDLESIIRADKLCNAKQKVLRLLEYRPRSRVELQRRLTRAGFANEIIEETLRHLENLGLIDDVAFSKNWVNYRLRKNAIGSRRIRWELRQKGIPSELVEEALATAERSDELETALQAASRRLTKYAGLDESIKRQRLTAYLQRQGFEWETISQVLDKVCQTSEKE